MFYLNIFKKNRSSKTKEAHYYISEMKKYRFDFILNKRIIHTVAFAFGGCAIFLLANFLIFFSVNSKEKMDVKKQESIKADLDMYISQVSGAKSQYDSLKKEADNVYNIANKTIKWSEIINEITNLLPYDTVLTEVETISQSSFNDSIKNDDKNKAVPQSGTNTGTTGTTAGTTAGQTTGQTAKPAAPAAGSTTSTSKEEKKNINISSNNIISIKGKTLSMVNLSVFLSKIDNSQYFSKVEYKTAEETDGYISFTIFVFLF